MSFVPQDEIRGSKAQSLAPMIDFLFLMLLFFASLAVSRVTMQDTEIELVKVKASTREIAAEQTNPQKKINISVTATGEYKWVTEIRDYKMATPEAIGEELRRQHREGLLPDDKALTVVLLKIDQHAQWSPIMHVIFAVRDAGFEVHPVYQVEDQVDG